MHILVVRHAIAEELSSSGKDQDRPISLDGCKKFEVTCKKLSASDLKFDLLLDSPLLRSQQTADIFCKYISIKNRQRSENLRPLAEVSDLFLEIEAYNVDSVVIIGHQPFLTKFINQSLSKGETEPAFLERGVMLSLEFPVNLKPASAFIK